MNVTHLVVDGRSEDLADAGDGLQQHHGLVPEHRGEDRLLELAELLVGSGDQMKKGSPR